MQQPNRSAVLAPVVGIAAAVLAAIVFTVAENVGAPHRFGKSVFVLLRIIGWTLLGSAVLALGVSLAVLVLRGARRAPRRWQEVALAVAAVVIGTAVVRSHPLQGSGGARAETRADGRRSRGVERERSAS